MHSDAILQSIDSESWQFYPTVPHSDPWPRRHLRALKCESAASPWAQTNAALPRDERPLRTAAADFTAHDSAEKSALETDKHLIITHRQSSVGYCCKKDIIIDGDSFRVSNKRQETSLLVAVQSVILWNGNHTKKEDGEKKPRWATIKTQKCGSVIIGHGAKYSRLE